MKDLKTKVAKTWLENYLEGPLKDERNFQIFSVAKEI